VLNRLIRGFTANAAKRLPSRIAEEKRFGKTLRDAVERADHQKRALGPGTSGSAPTTRHIRKFAEFLADDPIIVKKR